MSGMDFVHKGVFLTGLLLADSIPEGLLNSRRWNWRTVMIEMVANSICDVDACS